MKKHFLPFVLSLLLALPVTPFLHAQVTRAHQEPDTELGKLMQKVNESWRKLKKQVADPASNAASLELVANMSAGLEKAIPLIPARAEDVPAADRKKYIESYRARMKELIAELPKLESALKANDNPAAEALVKKIGAMQREDHKDYRRPEM